ncbi:MAG: N-acetylmuramoyl-L-alanine amidase [bacterium]|nr:N-acetylmuramoyl-L-alanine amidase [bacterium]
MGDVCDTSLKADWRDAPNFEERRNDLIPSLLIMHYTGMESTQAALDILCSPESNVSCHYLVDEHGTITQMVMEQHRAWHAGRAHWAGKNDINSCSIGIEIANEGHVLELQPFPDQQIEAVMALSKDILKRHDILAQNVIGHSDIAPARKKDPGEKFPWNRLHENGIGHFVEPEPIGDDLGYGIGDTNKEIAKMQHLLVQYGYQINENGHFDETSDFVVRAFQRHFRPLKIDGRLDHSTIMTLNKLIATLP